MSKAEIKWDSSGPFVQFKDTTELHMERLKSDVSAEQRKRRERIATAAMQGLMSKEVNADPKQRTDTYLALLAEVSVIAADALIAELDKEQPR